VSPIWLALLTGTAAAREPLWAFARDENEQPLEWHCDDDQVRVIQGTVPWATAVEARRSYARTYSAIAELENGLLPALDARKKGGVWRIGWNTLFHVTELPSTACGELASQVYDVGAYNMSLGFGNERFSFFYSAAATYALTTQHWADRSIKHGGGLLVGHFYSLTAPLWGSRVINADQIGGDAITDNWSFLSSGDGAIGGISLDYIAGARADLDYAVLGVGYVGSRGLFATVRQPQSGLFLDSVTDLQSLSGAELSLLRYLKTGVSAFRWFQGAKSELGRKLGATDLSFARYMAARPTGQVLQVGDQDRSAELAQDGFSLTHLQQRNLWELVDVSARYQIQPQPMLYELGLRVHTRGYHTDLIPGRRGRATVPDGTAASASLGLVNLPARTWYGVDGGVRPHLEVDYLFFMNESRVSDSNVRASLRYNDPDTLIVFPFAQNAVETHLTAEISL
jgi:hypothetical protein